MVQNYINEHGQEIYSSACDNYNFINCDYIGSNKIRKNYIKECISDVIENEYNDKEDLKDMDVRNLISFIVTNPIKNKIGYTDIVRDKDKECLKQIVSISDQIINDEMFQKIYKFAIRDENILDNIFMFYSENDVMFGFDIEPVKALYERGILVSYNKGWKLYKKSNKLFYNIS